MGEAGMRVLNVGCGPPSRWIPDTEGVDLINFGQQWVGDILALDIPPGVERIYCHHMVEHVPDTVALMQRFYDLLLPEGLLDIRVPLYPFPQAFQDPTHVKFIPSVEFFRYFTDRSPAGHCYIEGQFLLLSSETGRWPWELHVVLRKVD
jgi:hypothetical protein